MIKADEKLLMQTIRARPTRPMDPNGPSMFDVFKELGIHEKRGHYILQKWTDKGYWDYGLWAFGGWFTEKGKTVEL